jgi:hypothetical protein
MFLGFFRPKINQKKFANNTFRLYTLKLKKKNQNRVNLTRTRMYLMKFLFLNKHFLLVKIYFRKRL